jgi:hypothetical protein
MKPLLAFKRQLLLLGAAFAALFPATGDARSLCVQVINDLGIERSVPVSLGGTLRLSFRHSIYGSQVEEVFALRPGGFQLTQLRYGEARLVEFYGHESAARDNDAWVVTPAPIYLSSLDLKSSSNAAMSVRFDESAFAKPLLIPPRGTLRLTVAACDQSANG